MSVCRSTRVRDIFAKCVESVEPGRLIRTVVRREGVDTLRVRDLQLVLDGNCYVVGFGKGTYKMAVELERILGPHLREGVLSIPEGTQIVRTLPRVRIYEGAKDNLPDESAYEAAVSIRSLAEARTHGDIMFVLVSGGGSALLPHPAPPLTLDEKRATIKLLVSVGADIVQMNVVRSALSTLKGGKLAVLAYPATTVALILSDVIGDPLHALASGPTIAPPAPDENQKAVRVLKELGVYDAVPENVRVVLRRERDGVDDDHKVDEPSPWLHNIVIGNNATALATAKIDAERTGYVPIIVSSRIAGLASDVADMYAALLECICTHSKANSPAEEFVQQLNTLLVKSAAGVEDVVEAVTKHADTLGTSVRAGRRLALIGGGEPTVKVKGNGRGGRNQELALEMAVRLDNLKSSRLTDGFDVVFASIGTDGIDGPTDAAGAWSYVDLVEDARVHFGLDADAYLRENDSYSFFSTYSHGSCHIKTGHTGTNVMDMHFMIFGTK